MHKLIIQLLTAVHGVNVSRHKFLYQSDALARETARLENFSANVGSEASVSKGEGKDKGAK